jgi:transcriptional regulator with XRE-family HTH domain
MSPLIGNTRRVFHLGDVIRKRRREKKRTNDELAEEAGLDKMTVSMIERGVTNPRPESSDKIASALGTTRAKLEDQLRADGDRGPGRDQQIVARQVDREAVRTLLLRCNQVNDAGIARLIEEAELIARSDKYRTKGKRSTERPTFPVHATAKDHPRKGDRRR